jgi:hypothetical protein
MIDRRSVSSDTGTRRKQSGKELIHHWNRLSSKGVQRGVFDHHDRELRGEILAALHDGGFGQSRRQRKPVAV